MAVILFFIAHWYFSLFCQTFFHHRYAAHGAFTMSKGWEKFFYILSFITQGSSYLSVRAYAVMHRMHHAYADTELDPHSPQYSKNIFDMMWRTYKIYRGIFYKTIATEEKFNKNVPDWAVFEKIVGSYPVRLGWIAAYTWFYIAFATSPWLFILLPFQILMSPVHGAVINWFAHKFGYQNFEVKNTSENLLHFDFLMLGESYHNNHHKHPSSVNFGFKWHEIDPVYFVTLALNKIGVIHIPKQRPVPIVTLAGEPNLEEVGAKEESF